MSKMVNKLITRYGLMKHRKYLYCIVFPLLIFVITGCANTDKSENNFTEMVEVGKKTPIYTDIEEPESMEYIVYNDIPFKIYLRVFVPIFLTEQYDVEISDFTGEDVVITTEKDWLTFANAICPFLLKYQEPDFSKEYAIISANIISNTSLARYSVDVGEVIMENGILCIMCPAERDETKVIYGANVPEKQLHQVFMNIVTVNKDELPESPKNVIHF